MGIPLIYSKKEMSVTVSNTYRRGRTDEKFLRAVHPAFAVISVGADNDYGHPAQKTLSRLEAQDIQILRTDLSGTITAYSTPDTLTWSTGR